MFNQKKKLMRCPHKVKFIGHIAAVFGWVWLRVKKITNKVGWKTGNTNNYLFGLI